MNLNPFMEDADIPFEPGEVQYSFARITIWLTIYVTAGRFYCIAFPLKVKQIITPRNKKVIICVIYSVIILTIVPGTVSMYMEEKYIEARNQTRIINRDFKEEVEVIAFLLYAVIEFVSFATLILFTGLLVINLKRRSNWWKKSKFDKNQSNAISNRNRRTTKMVGLIAIVLIICFTPSIMLHETVFAVGFAVGFVGPFVLIFHTTWSIAFIAEAINSSVNIFLYYKMSSKYRRTFHELFAFCDISKYEKAGNEKNQS